MSQHKESGFTVVEMMIVMAVGVTLLAMAMMASGGALTAFKARGVVSKVQATFVQARELAISQQRDMQVNFVGTNEIDIVRVDLPSGTTTMQKTFFEGGMIFTRVTGLADPTFDVWGGTGTTPIVFAPATDIQFRAGTGVLIDRATLLPVSGRVFVGIASKPETAGMISVFGPTGRIRAYHWEGTWVW
jgi:prepilin-type N-terminal cleavage/methylation domain-containing protein